MKLSPFVGLVTVSIAVDLKKNFNLAKGAKGGGAQCGFSWSTWSLASSSIVNDRSLKFLSYILLTEVIIFCSGRFLPLCSVFGEIDIEKC